MAIITKKLWELFEVNWLMMRQNPGGKSAYLQGYLLGFTGTVNILPALDAVSKKGEIKLKVGNDPVQLKEIDFSTGTPSELTPAKAVTVLNTAGFTGCTFSVDMETGRLKLAPTDANIKFIQIYGELAAALNFGNCRSGQGKGCYLWASFDGDLKSVTETEEWGEDKKITNESPVGKLVSYTIPGERGGTHIVITDRLASREAKQMINGGIWIAGDVNKPEIYEPSVDAGETLKVDVFTYSKILEKNSNTKGDERFIRERLYIGGVGHMARTGGAGSFTDSEYTLTFGTYIGEDAAEHSSPRESDYTLSQWEALGLSGIIESDWENA